MNMEICILAGGLSTRLGRDKARLKLHGQTMLTRIRCTALEMGCPVRVLRRDLVARCGPLGGIFTALKTTRAEAVLFLACDMPLVTAALLRRIMRASGAGARAVGAVQSKRVGFPLILPVAFLAAIEAQLQSKEFSLQALVEKLHVRRLMVSLRRTELFNVNTPEDAAAARNHLAALGSPARPRTGLSRRTSDGIPPQNGRV